MNHSLQKLLVSVILILFAQIKVRAATPNQTYNPIPLAVGKEIKDTLTKSDIPTGEGAFARDYSVTLKVGEQIAIELKSDSCDTIVTLLSPKGSVVAENDDATDDGSNSLLLYRINKSGQYTVRVRCFGTEKIEGPFTLKLTRLRPE